MRINRVSIGILRRRFMAWLRKWFGEKPLVMPRIIIPSRQWNDSDQRQEEQLYLAGTSAFWLRPDRHLHDCSVWEIEGEYTPSQPDEVGHSAHVFSRSDNQQTGVWLGTMRLHGCRGYGMSSAAQSALAAQAQAAYQSHLFQMAQQQSTHPKNQAANQFNGLLGRRPFTIFPTF